MSRQVFLGLFFCFMLDGYARQDVPDLTTYDLSNDPSQNLIEDRRYNLAQDTVLTIFEERLQTLPCEEVERLFEETDRGYIYRLECLLKEIGIRRFFLDEQKKIINEYYKHNKQSIEEKAYNFEDQSLKDQLDEAVEKWLFCSGVSLSDLQQMSLTICPIIPLRLNGPCTWWNMTALPQNYVDVLYGWFRVRMMRG